MAEYYHDEDGEDFFHEPAYKTVNDALLITIDMSASMLTPPRVDEGKQKKKSMQKDSHLSPAVAALKCAYELMKQRIISNPKDKIGVLLYGTDTTKAVKDNESGNPDGNTYSNCYVLVDLDIPSASDVKLLGDLIGLAESMTGDVPIEADDGSVDQELLALLRPTSKEQASMSTLFLCANQIFYTRARNFISRRMFIVTDNDKPHTGSKDAIAAATVRAKDLFDSGVLVDLFPIVATSKPPGTAFDRSAFYSDIVYGMGGEGAIAPIGIIGTPSTLTSSTGTSQEGDGISVLNSLLSSITSRAANKRAIMNASMILGPNMTISVRGFINLKRQLPVRSSYVWLHGSQPQLAYGATARIAEDTGRTIESSDEIRKAFKFGGSSIPFSKEEILKLRTFEAEELKQPGSYIRIVGFKPQSALPAWARIRPPMFLYPSEHEYTGSTRVFAALFQSLQEKKKMAVVWCVLRKNGGPTLAAMVPTVKDSTTSPQGLYLIPLPFTEDLRQVPDNMTTVPSTNLLGLSAVQPLCDVIYQLNLPNSSYDPSRYPNPSLQQFYSILRALALDEDLPEDVKDKTLPRYSQINKRVGENLQACMQLIEKDARMLQAKFMKRGSSPDEGAISGPGKRVKTATSGKKISSSDTAGGGIISDDDMFECYKAGTLNKHTVAILKAWVGSKDGLANVALTAKRKNDWIACVDSFFDSQVKK